MRHLFASLLVGSACVATQAQDLPPAPYETSLKREVALLKQGVVQRSPGEGEVAFLTRLFPAALEPARLIRHPWRLGGYGPQLFFWREQRDESHCLGEGTELFVLDSFQPLTYAVQVLQLKPIGDITNLLAFFFADIEQDGQKELPALVYAEVQENGMLYAKPGAKGIPVYSHVTHWQTQVFRYAGLSPQAARATSVTERPDLTSMSWVLPLR
ncbi:hypothetical protein [Hymenobacter sp. BT559]|uniref:hypothetical protein n=1 Tax=Hymenobacter sp. BT559 TaxID=2795729 RepID=UPI0018EC02FB|nr:hypothetical protein [Hymenobacter sp. BT559]MBJ6142786.1 hypothetical protein [Hymenobacter sp. BT559]